MIPVGRLDLATSGLLILTNDTQFANWLTDPDTAIPRVYLVTVEGRVDAATIAQLERGVVVGRRTARRRMRRPCARRQEKKAT